MGSASRYWRLVKLDATGRCRVEEVQAAKAFFQQHFPNWAQQAEGTDLTIQRHLLNMRDAAVTADPEVFTLAELCLRCFISNQIQQVCRHIESQFGSNHGVTIADLLPFVLDDAGEKRLNAQHPSSYLSLADQILQSFDPARGSLSTWVMRLVRNHRELNRFLLEQGVYMVSDWAILNDTQPRQLPRFLGEFHALTPSEVEAFGQLLQRYHAVYRRDRLQQRQTGGAGRCVPPTPTQLLEIARPKAEPTADPQLLIDRTLKQLQTLASYLRQYRIVARGGRPQTDSLDEPAIALQSERWQNLETDGADEEPAEFLAAYRQQLVHCLDQTVAQVIGDRIAYLQRRKPQTVIQFLKALQLFHCQGQSMGQIAQQVGLQQQYQVTRLLKLKEFRADVRQRLLVLLRDRVLQQATAYVDAVRLQTLDRQIEAALNDQVESLIQAAETEASTVHDRPFTNLFARRLCHHLDARSLA